MSGPARAMPIRAQMLALTLAFALPAAGLLAWYLVNEEQEATREAYATVDRLAERTTANVAQALRERGEILRRIAELPQVSALDAAGCDHLRGDYGSLLPEDAGFDLRDANGRSVCAFGAHASATGAVVDLPWFREGLRSDGIAVGGASPGNAPGGWFATLTHPVRDGAGKVSGLASLRLDLPQLGRVLLAAVPQRASVAVVDGDSRFLIRSADAAEWIGKPLPERLAEAIRGRDRGLLRMPSVAGIPHLWAFVSVPGTVWTVSVGLPEADVFADHRALLVRSVVIGVAVLLLALGLVLHASGRISGPIRELARTSARIAAGDRNVRARIAGPAEIADVAQQMNRMLDTVARQQEERTALTSHYQTLVSKARDVILLMNEDGAIVDANEAAVAAYGWTAAELRSMNVRELRTEAERGGFDADWRAAATADSVLFETVHRRKDGSAMPVEVSSSAIEVGGTSYRQSFIRDIGARKCAEALLQRSHRALRTISHCNEVLVRATDEAMLLDEVCRLIVDLGGYRMAWVGYAETDERHSVRPVAQAGFDAGYLESVAVTWSGDERGQGPTGSAIRSRRPVVARNLQSEPGFEPWRAAAALHGYGASIALPLLPGGDTCLGALSIYAAEADAFEPDETRLLVDLADDLAFGIRALRDRAALAAAERELRLTATRQRHLLENSPTVLFSMGEAGASLYATDVSENIERIVGYTPAEALAPRWWVTHLHPDDREAAIAAFRRFEATGHLAHEYRFARKDGSYLWVHEFLQLRRDAAGRTMEAVGAWTDVTGLKEAEERVHRQLDELRRWQRIMLGREGRSLALKAEINALLAQSGQPPRYAAATEPPVDAHG